MSPPLSLLPPLAAKWDVVNEVAIRLGRDVRTVESWCEKGLLHTLKLAGGYGGIWVAVTADGWPLDGPNVSAYSERRSEQCRQREAAKVEQAKPAPKKARRRKSA